MPTFKVERISGYTIMSNYHLRDASLSLKAKGLLSLMLSLPPEWDYTENGLVQIVAEGRDSVRSAVKELLEAGYLTRERTRENGQLKGAEYTVREVPAGAENGGKPVTEKPMLENPILDNPTEINKEEINKDLINPPIVPPQKPMKLPKHEPGRFAGFWAMYPRHENKPKAIQAWDKLHLTGKEIDDLARGLQWFLASEMWSKGIGIPYASTWLNQRRWEERHEAVPDGGVQEGAGAYRL